MNLADTFRNTAFVDMLEFAGLVHLSSNFAPQPAAPNSALHDLEKQSKGAYGAGTDIEANTTSQTAAILPKAAHISREPFVENFLVDWNGLNDPENPQNWPSWKKRLVISQTMLLAFSTYMGASIYVPSEIEVQQHFHVGHVVATLNLSLFIIGYGVGPMFLSPLSEEYVVGRNRIYVVSVALFAILQIPIALVNNIGGMLALRFITGILSSPSISTGGATIGDILSGVWVSRTIGLWAACSVAAPVFGPLLGGALVVAEDWRWIFWFLAMLNAATTVVVFFFLPETLHSNILYRRAKRIRQITGDSRYYTADEAAGAKWPSPLEVARRPIAMMLAEPGIIAFNLYTGLVYGAFYLLLEGIPLVYVVMYNFTFVESGVTGCLGSGIGCIVGVCLLFFFLNHVVECRISAGTYLPEHQLILCMFVCFLLPASLLLFGWTAGVHWMLTAVSHGLFTLAAYCILQCGLGYLTLSYPRYLASVLAGNALVRSVIAGGFALFGQNMYNGLATPRFPVAWGASLLAFVCLTMTLIPFAMYRYGSYLRGKSRFAN